MPLLTHEKLNDFHEKQNEDLGWMVFFKPQLHLHTDSPFASYDRDEFGWLLLRAFTIAPECIVTICLTFMSTVFSALYIALLPVIIPLSASLLAIAHLDSTEKDADWFEKFLSTAIFQPLCILACSVASLLLNIVYLPIAAPIALAKIGTRSVASLFPTTSENKKEDGDFSKQQGMSSASGVV